MANTAWSATDKSANITLTGSNLIATSTSVSRGIVRAADCQVAGKFYFEYTCNVIAGANTSLGIATSLMTSAGALSDLNACQINKTSGQVWANGANAFTFGTSLANGNVVCIALDCTARLIWFRIGAAGNWNNNATYNPATGVGGVAIFNFGAALQAFPFAGLQATSDQITANFGDSAFVGAVPSGYTSGFTAGSTPTIGWEAATATAVTLSGSNLVATNTGTTSADQGAHVAAVNGKTSGKWYFETTWTTIVGVGGNVGIGIGTTTSTYTNMGNSATVGAALFRGSGDIYANGTRIVIGAGGYSPGQSTGIAFDLDNRRFWARQTPSGTWNNSGTADPATNVGGITIPAGTMVPFLTFGGGGGAAGNVVTTNFGASAFIGAMPSGFTSLDTFTPIPTNALASQALAEHWLTTSPQAQITQVILEHWMSVAEGAPVVPSLDTRVMVLA